MVLVDTSVAYTGLNPDVLQVLFLDTNLYYQQKQTEEPCMSLWFMSHTHVHKTSSSNFSATVSSSKMFSHHLKL